MTPYKAKWLLGGLLCLVLLPAFAHAQWPEHTEEAIEAWVKEIEDSYGPDSPATIFKFFLMAEHYRAQGRHALAEPIYKRLLARMEKGSRADSSSAAGVANDLGAIYHDQGRYAAAESFHRRALAIRQKGSWPDNPGAAHSLHNLAVVYYDQGRHAEAEPLYLRALAIWKKSLGDDLLYEVRGLENYANLLRKTGRGPEALKMEARAKAIRAKHAEKNPAN